MAVVPFTALGVVPARPVRLRRSTLAVPGSSERMMARAATSEADEIFLDLEDDVAPDQKTSARARVVAALQTNDYSGKLVAVRVNDAASPHQYRDLIDVVRGAGERIDTIILPKVQHPGEVWFAEHLLSQLELDLGLNRRIGLQLQVETGSGAVHLADITRVTDRTEALVFGPGDYAADLGVVSVDVGLLDRGYPGHQWHYVLSRLVTHARAVGGDAIDGPYADVHDHEGLRESTALARHLGVDGKWCIHPAQIPVVNEAFTPTADEMERARALLAAYAEAVTDGRGAATFEGRMIDEANRKMADRIVARGAAAAL
jgi:citrate lyase subunit beta/citryl-CoA lyase